MKSFSDLTEQETLALAISSEEDAARAYGMFSHELAKDYPASAKVFTEMAAEETEHSDLLKKAYTKKFGDFIPLIRRDDVKGFERRRPAYALLKEGIEEMCASVEAMEAEAHNFYVAVAARSSDPAIKKLLLELAEAEKGHESVKEKLGLAHESEKMKAAEKEAEHRAFLLEYVQPGLIGLMDGSVSTLAPIFAAAFATHSTWSTFLVGLAASVGAGISMGLAEGLSDDGVLTGRGSPMKRGLASGVMTMVGGLGHTLPFLIPHFNTAFVVAVIVVLVELAAISWIRWKYMDTPFLKAALQIAVGGFLVFLTGILIGSA
jgi:erythrin-vacuolar iron transport family protein